MENKTTCRLVYIDPRGDPLDEDVFNLRSFDRILALGRPSIFSLALRCVYQH
jgi:hypothetical protein